METKRSNLLGAGIDWPRELPGQRNFRRPHFQECYSQALTSTDTPEGIDSTVGAAIRDSNRPDFETVSKAGLSLLACADRLVATDAACSGGLDAIDGVKKAVEYYHFAGNNFSRLNQFERAAEFYLCSGLAGIALLRFIRPDARAGLAGTTELAHRSLLRARSFFRQSGDDLNAERAWVEAFELQRLNSPALSLKRAGFEVWRAASRYGTEMTAGGWLMILGSWVLFTGLRLQFSVQTPSVSEAAVDAALALLTLDEISGAGVPIGLRFANAVIGLGLTGLLVQLIFQKLSSRS
jgi:hypothetical protein